MIAAILNIIVITLCLWGIWRGWRRGFALQVPSLLAWCLGIIAALIGGESLAQLIMQEGLTAQYIDATFVAVYLSASLLYFCVYLMIRIVGSLFTAAFARISSGPINACIGAAAGLLKYATALSLLLNLWSAISQDCVALKIADQGDGGVIEAVMLLSPAITSTPSFHELLHRRQLREAKKISLHNRNDNNVWSATRPQNIKYA